MTLRGVSAAVLYIASKVPPPPGVELFVDDGLAAVRVDAYDEEGVLREWWLVRFLKREERKVRSWAIPTDVTPKGLYDCYLQALDTDKWDDWPA